MKDMLGSMMSAVKISCSMKQNFFSSLPFCVQPTGCLDLL
jgi:hypothetical protein